jgi:hypothetical protein
MRLAALTVKRGGKNAQVAARLLKSAAKDVSQSNSAFSSKERKELGPMVELFNAHTDELVGRLQSKFLEFSASEGKSAADVLRSAIKEQYGEHGLEQAAPFITPWLVHLVESAISSDFLDQLPDTFHSDDEETKPDEESDDKDLSEDKEEKNANSSGSVSLANRAREIAKGARKSGRIASAERLEQIADRIAAGE